MVRKTQRGCCAVLRQTLSNDPDPGAVVAALNIFGCFGEGDDVCWDLEA